MRADVRPCHKRICTAKPRTFSKVKRVEANLSNSLCIMQYTFIQIESRSLCNISGRLLLSNTHCSKIPYVVVPSSIGSSLPLS